MCVSAPKAPKVEPVPVREAARLPDNGDPLVRESQRNRRRIAMQAMALGGGSIGAPRVSTPLGATGTI